MPEIAPSPAANAPFLRPAQIEDLQNEAATIQKQLDDPYNQIVDPAAASRTLGKIKYQLDKYTPPAVQPGDLDSIVKRERELREYIQEGMLSRDEMMRNPPGAVGQHMRHEEEKKNAILEWKNLRRRLHKGSDDPDVANVEILRPETPCLGMSGAQIPRKRMYFFPDEQARHDWDRIFGDKEPMQVALDHEALREQVEELQARLDAQEASKEPIQPADGG